MSLFYAIELDARFFLVGTFLCNSLREYKWMNTSKHFLLYSIGYFTADSRNFHSFKDVFKNLPENSLGLEGKKNQI